jgi:hypothetical protein
MVARSRRDHRLPIKKKQKRKIFCVYFRILSLVILHANRTLSVQICVAIRGLYSSAIFFPHYYKRHNYR